MATIMATLLPPLLLPGLIVMGKPSVFALSSDSIVGEPSFPGIIGSLLCFAYGLTHLLLTCCAPRIRPALSLSMLFGLVTLIICVNIHPISSTIPATVYLVVVCIMLILGTILGRMQWMREWILEGATGLVGGYALSVCLLDAGMLDYLSHRWEHGIILLAGSLILGLPMIFLHVARPFFMALSISATGASLFVCGVDFYLGTGFRGTFVDYVEREWSPLVALVEISIKVLAFTVLVITVITTCIILCCPCQCGMVERIRKIRQKRQQGPFGVDEGGLGRSYLKKL
ncbi:MAG: hypothetical protein DHS80DRAFT_30631 [Piptocephalis tieghemiana]|nr:MAG: hypothetical protein DHS80DRAFT_30631 [Piptocephalis tieghemiana]